MDFLADFFQEPRLLSDEDFSFNYFKKLWKEYRLQYIWLIKHPQEPQDMFFNELILFVVDRILEECQRPAHERNLAVFVACTYSMAVLYQTQPIIKHPEIKFPSFHAEETEERSFILVPEYCFDALVAMYSALKCEDDGATKEASETLTWLFQTDAFMFCVERPVRYFPGGKSPYPKERHPQVFTNGSHSRHSLNSLQSLLGDMQFAELSRQYQSYEQNLQRFFGKSSNNPKFGNTFLQEVDRIRKTHSSWKKKIDSKREQIKYRHLKNVTIPIRPASTLVTPVTDRVKDQYYKACKRYKQLIECANPEDLEELVQDLEEPAPRKKRKKRSKPQPGDLAKDEPVANEHFESKREKAPRRKKRPASDIFLQEERPVFKKRKRLPKSLQPSEFVESDEDYEPPKRKRQPKPRVAVKLLMPKIKMEMPKLLNPRVKDEDEDYVVPHDAAEEEADDEELMNYLRKF